MAHLALDLGLSLGWAIHRDDGEIESGVRWLTDAGGTDGARFFDEAGQILRKGRRGVGFALRENPQ